MRAFVTGSNGFLGTHLLRKLGQPAVGLVRDRFVYVSAGTKELPAPNATICYGDLSSIKTLERIITEYKIDTVFQLAAQTEIGTAAADPVSTFESNIQGTWNVLEACRLQGVKRVIVASSDKAYGRNPPPYKESMSLLPDRPYETSKACVDLLAVTYASTYKMSIATTRCVNLYGPECLSLTTLIPNTIKRVLRGERPIIRNGGVMRRDWLYVEDAVDAYLKLAASDYVGPMNFGSGVGVPVCEIVNILLELMGSSLTPMNETDKHGEIVDQWTDATLARNTLGWTPKHTLKEGLEKTLAWYLDYYKHGKSD